MGTTSLLLCLLFLGKGLGQKRILNEVKPEELTFFIPPVPLVSTEQLQDVLSRARALRSKATKQPAAVAAAIAAAVGTLPPVPLQQAFRVLKTLPAEVLAHLPSAVDLLARIRSLGTSTECRKRHAGRGPPGSPGVLIAANLNDCEEIMPYWILEVLRLALLLREDPILQAIYAHQGAPAPAPFTYDPATKPPEHVAVSVYESGSTDSTPVWLQVAEALWGAAGVPNGIVMNGTLTRQKDLLDRSSGKLYKQHRIQHLANLRNVALQPLLVRPDAFQYVMFVNDIFFCAPDLMRLTYLEADIACGIDVEVWVGGHVPKIKDAGKLSRLLAAGKQAGGRRLAAAATASASTGASTDPLSTDPLSTDPLSTDERARLAKNLELPLLLDDPSISQRQGRERARGLHQGRGLLQGGGEAVTGADVVSGASGEVRASWKAAVELMGRVHSSEDQRQADANEKIANAPVKPRYEFYDIWVSRDIGGSAFIKHDPIARDLRTVELLHRGMPFPVKCCWNGAVFLNASHIKEGLRFRSGMRGDGECDASECSIFCEDYRRLGSGRVAIDPSVRVSYAPWTSDIHGPLPGGIPSKVPWSAVRRSGALERVHALWNETRDDMWMECVPLRKGFDGADLDRVRRVNIRDENFTRVFLERSRQPSPPPSRTCNLIMGGYGATDDGDFFDDLPYASWGKSPITRIVSLSGEFVNSLQVVYGTLPAKQHGGNHGDVREHTVEAGEFINSAVVYYDERAVHGMDLGTSVGRRIVIGTLREGVSRAKATPCPADPAHEGRYRLIAFAGTSDRYLRSVTLLWS